MKQDLVISAYKPKESFHREFLKKAGTEETAWVFVDQHLSNLPVVVDADKNGKLDIVTERQAFLLFDRMVAYHIMSGLSVPMDSADFYRGLDERYLQRDSMYFLADQVNEYDTARIKMDVEPIQFELFVTNEKSAIAWLYQQLDEPKTYAEIQPKFMQEIKAVDKFEDMPELQVILEENFLQDEKGRWYIPDVKRWSDITEEITNEYLLTLTPHNRECMRKDLYQFYKFALRKKHIFPFLWSIIKPENYQGRQRR